MGNYELLKAAINEVIKANGRQEITGEVLNQVLLSMVYSLGAGYQCMGVATPSTNPGTPDQNVFYFATQAGTYTNFNAIVLQAGISVLIWDGEWSSQTWFTIDSSPTNNSQNLIASGAVFNALKLDGGAYDVTAHNSGATFASLSALLNSANLNTLIPTEIRHGGMSIKFVQSSDNKYVQYLYHGTSTTVADFTNTANWEKTNLEEEVGQLGQETGITIKLEPTSYSNRVHAIVKGGVNIEVNSDYCINYVLNITDSLNEVLVNSNFNLEKYVLNVVGEYDIVFARKDNTNIDVNDNIIKIFSSRNVDTIQGFPIIDVNSIKAYDGNFTTPAARNSVPVHLRKIYAILKYKTSSGIVFEQFMDNPQSQERWVYGTYKRLFSGNYIYANELLNVDVIANKGQARAIAGIYCPKGSIILYYMSDGWHIELKTGTTSSALDRYYKEIAFKDYVDEKITETTNSSLYNGSLEKVLMSDDYEVGGIDDSGNDVSADFCYRTRKIKTLNPCVILNQADIVAFYYDNAGAYIGKSTGNPFTKNDIIIPNTASYVRIVIDNRSYKDISFYNSKCVVGRILNNNDGSILSINRDKYYIVQLDNLENGYFNEIGVYMGTHPKICYTPKFIKVKKGDVVRAIAQDFGIAVAEYSEENESSFIKGSDGIYFNNFIASSPYFSHIGDYIVRNDGYIRIEVMKYDNTTYERVNINADEIGVVCCLIHTLDYLGKKIIRDNKIYFPRIELLSLQEESSIVGNDGTIIGDELWCFGASEENDGYVRKFDLATNQVISTITHNLGHANCVDYNKFSDTLLTTDVLGHTIPDDKRVYIQLLANPSVKESLLQSDCIRIPMFTNNMERYVYAQFCFGESFNILYGFEYAFDGKKAYKIELGIGNNDYSSDVNGFGTFISGKSSEEYNGTARLIKTYYGEIHEGDATMSGERGGAQGMCYDGRLYLCWSVGRTNILAIELDELAGTFNVVRDYAHIFYEDSEHYLNYEPEIISIKDGRMYAGSRHVVMNNNVVTKIKGAIFSFNK